MSSKSSLSVLQLALAGALLLFLTVVLRAWRRQQAPLPPGLPSDRKFDRPWQVYAAWSKTLGALLTVNASSRPIIVINTVEAANDLLGKRAHFSCKPRWPMAELLGRQKNVGFIYYGDRLRRTRKLLNASLNAHAVDSDWNQHLDDGSLELVRRMMSSPTTVYEDVQQSVKKMVARFTYGYAPSPKYLDLARDVAAQTGIALQPGRWAVNSFPILMYVPSWIPGADFQRWAKSARAAFHELTHVPYNKTKEQMARGCAQPSFVKKALEISTETQDREDIILSAAGSLYGAGTDTISGTILTFLVLISHHPEVQKRAYEEILAVVGSDRLPGAEDQASLQYLDCVIQEVHRFNPSVPLVTHSNNKEDYYLGYRIPNKTWILANVWGMLHDETEYPDPERFLPDRFLHEDGAPAPRDPRTLVYGFGRRVCPGLHFANRFVYLAACRILSAFEVLPQTQDGTGSLASIKFEPGLISIPAPFKCILVPRPGAALFETKLVDGPQTLSPAL